MNEICKCNKDARYGISWYDKTTFITEERYTTSIKNARKVIKDMKHDAGDGDWKETSKDHWEGSAGTYIWIYKL